MRKPMTLLLISAAGLTILGSCQSREDELSASTRTFRAPSDYAMVASDPERGLVTLRSTKNGELRVIDVRTRRTVLPATAATAPVATPMQPAIGRTEFTAAPLAAAAKAAVAYPPVFAIKNGAADSRTLVNGPGIHIERAQGPAHSAASAHSEPKRLRNVILDHGLICGAGEYLELTNVTLTTPSAGIVLQSGCRLALIDSEIRSADVAIIVNAGAGLQIENSIVRGRSASIQAAPSTQVRSWASTFIGPRAIDDADYVDRGGNVWE